MARGGIFGDIEVQICLFGVYGAYDVYRWQLIMKHIVLMHSCAPAYVIRHCNRAIKFH